jgi:flagellar motor switch protein FliN/FliY
MTGSTATVETGEPSTAASVTSDDGALWWEQPFQPIKNATIWVGASHSSWSSVGKLVLEAAGVDDATTEDLHGTYLEVVRQALSGVAQGLSGLTQADVRCEAGAERPPRSNVDIFPVRIRMEGSDPIDLSLVFSSGLVDRAPLPAEAPPPTAVAEVTKEPEEPDTKRTIDLLYDVELPVSVSFGRAHLPLKEVLKLTSGSIVELNRSVSEPVEIIVNNCVIARGEVVVVDGNYGVRIVQILSRRERLRTLY